MIEYEALSAWFEIDWIAGHLEHNRSIVYVWGQWVPYCDDCSVVLRRV